MDLTFTQIILFALTGWVWLLLPRVVRYDLHFVIPVQQWLGVRTAPLLYRLADSGRWLMIGGPAAVVTALLLPEIRTALLPGLLAVLLGLLTYAHHGAARLLRPDILKYFKAKLLDGGPDEPLPTA